MKDEAVLSIPIITYFYSLYIKSQSYWELGNCPKTLATRSATNKTFVNPTGSNYFDENSSLTAEENPSLNLIKNNKPNNKSVIYLVNYILNKQANTEN